MRCWTTEERSYLTDHWQKQTDEEIAAVLCRNRSSVQQCRLRLGLTHRESTRGPNWTEEERDYLQENWGTVSVKSMARRFGRTENAVVIMSQRLGLGAFLDSGDYITLRQLLAAVTGSEKTYSYKIKSWVENRGLPVKYKQVVNNKFRIVHLKDFWPWLEKNRDFVDLSKFEEGALGEEPEWMKSARKTAVMKAVKYTKEPWNSAEDSRLRMLLSQKRFTAHELSMMMGRTCGAIQRRIKDLGIEDAPIKADNMVKWTPEEYELLARRLSEGWNYELIAEEIGKSTKAIRGRVFDVYGTECIDKAREMIAGGKWGEGAPIKTVFQSKRRCSTKQDISKLAGLLAYRRNELGWSPYWQKDMCQHWSERHGCTKNQTDCDRCAEFQRIKPQYCSRCGMTFFERDQNKFCERCRDARRRQSLRKKAVLARKGNRQEEEAG